MALKRMVWKGAFLLMVLSLDPTEGLSNYLNSLSSGITPPEADEPERLAPGGEEWYGLTNPMANNLPGSKHQEYGGYLTKLDRSNSPSTVKENDEAPDEWYGKSNPMASWAGHKNPQWGGYLDTLGQGSIKEENQSD
jgi:hypothetical protein